MQAPLGVWGVFKNKIICKKTTLFLKLLSVKNNAN